MYRRFIGTVAAAAIAITAMGASAARADQEDVSRALAALLGIAVIGAIIHENKKDEAAVQQAHRPRHAHPPKPPRHVHAPRPRYAEPLRPRHVQPRIQPKPLPRHVQPRPRNQKLLPGHCFRTFETRRGEYRGFGRGCLRNHFEFAHRMPQRCLINLRTYRGDRAVYEARCLRSMGYQLARL